jgi:fatty-acyl-CoA synthase
VSASSPTNDEGWYDAGDIGFLVDSEVYISGRAKDLITRAGLNISPHHIKQVIERELALRPSSVAVFSVLDLRLAQERVCASIVGRDYNESQDKRLRVARSVVSETGLQLDVIEFVGSADLPKTTSGKIQRDALRRIYSHSDVCMGSPSDSSIALHPGSFPKPSSEALNV